MTRPSTPAVRVPTLGLPVGTGFQFPAADGSGRMVTARIAPTVAGDSEDFRVRTLVAAALDQWNTVAASRGGDTAEQLIARKLGLPDTMPPSGTRRAALMLAAAASAAGASLVGARVGDPSRLLCVQRCAHIVRNARKEG